MEGHTSPIWPAADLASLFEEYFGEKLTPAQLDGLVKDVRAALADRQAAARRLPARAVQPARTEATGAECLATDMAP